MSYGFWMRRFGGDRAALGGTLILDGEAYTLAGVLPPDFRFPRWKFMAEPDIYLPLLPNPDRRWHYVRVIGRLKPGVALAQARADMDLISAAIERAHPRENRGEGAALTPLSDELIYGTGAPLTAFGGAVLFVLIIGCANVSNLLLGQAVRRRREIAIRSALGASRARLLRQFLVETLVLALAGGAAGVLLASWGMPLLVAAVPVHSAFSERVAMGGIGLNWTVLGFAFAVSLVAAVLSGMLPAWRASRQDRSATFLTSRTVQRERVRGVLIAAEVALSLVLLAGAGLLVKSFIRLLAVDPGFNTRHLLTIDIELPDYKYSEVQQRAEFVRSALERLEHIPGVTAAAATDAMPLTKSSVTNGFNVPGSSEEIGSAGFRAVTPGYFEAMGIPLIRGRLPVRGDTAIGVINQAMARRFWPHEDPLGKEIETPRIERVRTAQGWTMRMTPERFRIVGIVGDVRHLTLDLAPRPEMFLLYSQMATADFTFVLRSQVDPGALARGARREILGGGSRPAAGQRPHRGPTDLAGCLRSPLRSPAAGRLCVARRCAGSGRHLRRGVAFGLAAHARDRHPHGAGRGRFGGDRRRGPAGPRLGRRGSVYRRRRFAGHRPRAARLSLRRRAARSRGIGNRRGYAGRNRRAGGVRPGPRCRPRGPRQHAPMRVDPSPLERAFERSPSFGLPLRLACSPRLPPAIPLQ